MRRSPGSMSGKLYLKISAIRFYRIMKQSKKLTAGTCSIVKKTMNSKKVLTVLSEIWTETAAARDLLIKYCFRFPAMAVNCDRCRLYTFCFTLQNKMCNPYSAIHFYSVYDKTAFIYIKFNILNFIKRSD
jgi:hypothetical protein